MVKTLKRKTKVRKRVYCTKCNRKYAINNEFMCGNCAYKYYLAYFTKKLNTSNLSHEDY